MDFTDYADSVDARTELARTDANRQKLWTKAFRPLLPRIHLATRILDFGCGGGEFLKFLSNHSEAELVGYDLSPSQLARARRLTASNSLVNIVEAQTEIRGPFSWVFCHHVIEHILDSDLPGFIGSLCSHVSEGGRLVIVTPNGLNPFAHTFFMASDRTHLRMHSPFTLAELFQPFGFEIESVHREHPQIYDLQSLLKTAVWFVFASFFRVGLLAHAAGVRGQKLPITMASSFYVVAKKVTPKKC